MWEYYGQDGSCLQEQRKAVELRSLQGELENEDSVAKVYEIILQLHESEVKRWSTSSDR